MKKGKNFLANAMASVLIIVTLDQSVIMADKLPRENVTDQQVRGSNIELVTTRESFVRSLTAARLPGGLVLERSCEVEENKLQREMQTLPLRERLNLIVQTDPQYRWISERGAINLIPLVGEPELLNIRIREFRVANATSLNLVLEQLLALPEVQAHPVGRRVNRGIRLIIEPSSPNPEQVRLHVRDVTLREALNAIVRARGRAVWAYTEQHCNGQDTFTIDFLVQ